MSYFDIYKLRLNRYGNDYATRMQNKRAEEFEHLLNKSVDRINFTYNNVTYPAVFETYKQDDTQTLRYLLTRLNNTFAQGLILALPDKDNLLQPWMVYYLEVDDARGYNRYVLLRMTHSLTWTARDKTLHTSRAYMFGPQRSKEVDKKEGSGAVYLENNNNYTFIMPVNSHLNVDDYFQLYHNGIEKQYRVTGYDIQSTDGVMFVSIDPTYKYDLTPAPTKQSGDKDEDFYWFEGGTS